MKDGKILTIEDMQERGRKWGLNLIRNEKGHRYAYTLHRDGTPFHHTKTLKEMREYFQGYVDAKTRVQRGG